MFLGNVTANLRDWFALTVCLCTYMYVLAIRQHVATPTIILNFHEENFVMRNQITKLINIVPQKFGAILWYH